MTRRRLTRALIALTVPALLVPALASSATAAEAPSVPTLAQVAKVYPFLDGGTADVTHEKVYEAGRNCKQGDPIKGARSKTATYAAPMDSESMDDYAVTGAKPAIVISAVRLPSAKIARSYLAGGRFEIKNCADKSELGAQKSTYKIKTIAFKLDAPHWGYQISWKSHKTRTIVNALFARDGATVVSLMSFSLQGRQGPSVGKSIDLVALALKSA